MKGILGSVGKALKGVADSLLSPAEDPRQAFAYTYQHQLELLARVQQAQANLATAEDRISRLIVDAQKKLELVEEQIHRALSKSQNNMVWLARERKQVILTELEALEQQLQESKAEQKRLAGIEQSLRNQIEAFFSRREIIMARHSAAEAQVFIHEAIADVSQEIDEIDGLLTRAEQKAVAVQERANAAADLFKIDRLPENSQDSSSASLPDDTDVRASLRKE